MTQYDAAVAADPSKTLGFHFLAGRSAGDAVGTAVVGDLVFIIIGFVVAFVWSIFILWRWHARWSKVLVMVCVCVL